MYKQKNVRINQSRIKSQRMVCMLYSVLYNQLLKSVKEYIYYTYNVTMFTTFTHLHYVGFSNTIIVEQPLK